MHFNIFDFFGKSMYFILCAYIIILRKDPKTLPKTVILHQVGSVEHTSKDKNPNQEKARSSKLLGSLFMHINGLAVRPAILD